MTAATEVTGVTEVTGQKMARCRWAATHRHRTPADRLSQLPAGGSRHETFVNAGCTRSDTVVIDALGSQLERPEEVFRDE